MFPAMQGDLQVGHAAKGLRKALDRTASDPRKAGADAWRCSGPRLVKGWIFHGLLLGFNHEMMVFHQQT